MSQEIPASISELKEKANTIFGQRNFVDANEIYQSIIEQQVHELPVQFVRILRSNRAACFIELGQYESAIAELDQIFQSPKYGPETALDERTDPIFSKVHFRKAICFCELAKTAEALHEFDIYRDLLVDGKVDHAEPKLRAKIQSLLGKSANPKPRTTMRRS